NHPTEIVKLEREVTVKVLKVDRVTERIALGLKQLQPNPWERVVSKYVVGQRVKGKVVNLMPYGAFVELEAGIEGLLHINDMSWTKKVVHPNEVVKKGDLLDVMVLTVDKDKKRIALGLKQMQDNPWSTTIPMRYAIGNAVSGKITKLVSFGAFVELEKDLEGLLHISKVDKDIEQAGLTPGDIVEVKAVKLEPAEGTIGL